jgi:hypothetical protein
MSRMHPLSQPQADFQALEANVARAGLALACAYSSSDEYEAAVIAARRQAGAYGPNWRQRQILWACTGVAVLVLIVFAG